MLSAPLLCRIPSCSPDSDESTALSPVSGWLCHRRTALRNGLAFYPGKLPTKSSPSTMNLSCNCSHPEISARFSDAGTPEASTAMWPRAILDHISLLSNQSPILNSCTVLGRSLPPCELQTLQNLSLWLTICFLDCCNRSAHFTAWGLGGWLRFGAFA